MPLCTCEWVMRDTGTMGNPVRVLAMPGCKVHDKQSKETSDGRGSESKEP